MAPWFEDERKRFSWKVMAEAIDEVARLIEKR